jgi:1-acyl-sn-glycerol-3-phosphate acyltransferase
MTALRSFLFNLCWYGLTVLSLLALTWTLILPRRLLMDVVVAGYLAALEAIEVHVLGLRYRVVGRDNLPSGAVLVAAKHQSAWETMKLHRLFRDPAVILKRELMRLPIWGWFAQRARMIPVDRGKRGQAIASMIEGARPVIAEGRPIVIFPQGTRVAPGAYRPYKAGVAALYAALDVPIVPVALNSGVFWGRKALRKRPGQITVEILPPIEPGLSRDEAIRLLEERLEAASDRLTVAAGGPKTHRPDPPPAEARPEP